jgi:plasmid segregation protein ParM
MIVGIDAGNHNVNVFDGEKLDCFRATIGEWRERTLRQKHGKDDMEVEWNGRKLFAGTLAVYESEFGGSLGGDTKAHDDGLLRVLIALHRLNNDREYCIVVGQPIKKHTDDEKQKIKTMLMQEHEIIINGVGRTFTIKRVEVAPEGSAAFWAMPQMGLVRIIDIGSCTVNLATVHDKRYIDKSSDTLDFGVDARKTTDNKAMARAIATRALQMWKSHDNVQIVGGDAEFFQPHITEFFPNSRVMKPVIQTSGKATIVHPVYANAIGNYQIARGVYGG